MVVWDDFGPEDPLNLQGALLSLKVLQCPPNAYDDLAGQINFAFIVSKVFLLPGLLLLRVDLK